MCSWGPDGEWMAISEACLALGKSIPNEAVLGQARPSRGQVTVAVCHVPIWVAGDPRSGVQWPLTITRPIRSFCRGAGDRPSGDFEARIALPVGGGTWANCSRASTT